MPAVHRKSMYSVVDQNVEGDPGAVWIILSRLQSALLLLVEKIVAAQPSDFVRALQVFFVRLAPPGSILANVTIVRKQKKESYPESLQIFGPGVSHHLFELVLQDHGRS